MSNISHLENSSVDNSMNSQNSRLCDLEGFWLNSWWVAPEHRTLTLVTGGAKASAQGFGDLQVLCERTLEPRLMKLLCRLAEQPGRVVSRETLVEYLWPRVIVNDNSLTRAVSDLRRALTLQTASVTDSSVNADADTRPVRIETVPKRGYSLSGTVVVPNNTNQGIPAGHWSDNGSSETVNNLAGTGHALSVGLLSSRVWRWLPAAAAAVLLTGNIALELFSQSNQNPVAPLASGQPAQVVPGETSPGMLDEVRSNRSLPAQASSASMIDSAATATMTGSELASGASTLHLSPSPLLWESDQHDFAIEGDALHQLTMLAPDGHILAYVEKQGGVSSLKLKPAFAESTETWVAFTTDEQITSMQWSPLGDGILFTVVNKMLEASDAAYKRLMLLDMGTLALHELYRKPVTPVQLHEPEQSGKLT
ncbi:transcriptional regulator [Pseudohongiella sp. O18]|uniref:winged helix-turn-helix domain-containing protein n=1 Tax=Pseudohongiella sp. O18 TaxID=2904248 RepID=UPI001F030C50|nr:winged helix-turn-helix domain-containing protein [Pseudohongiella sp. O18]